MPTVAEVQAALRVSDALPPGDDQVVTAERALQVADRLGDFRLRAQARINLVAAYDAAAPGDRELPHIAWLLGCLSPDAAKRPAGGREEVTERQRFEILWECRFALARTLRSTRVPLLVVQRIYSDVERHYRADGVSPNLYAKYRALLARDVDPQPVLDHWLGVWRNSPRDVLSDCTACDVATDARFLAGAGDLSGALDRAEDLIEGRLGCDREPHQLYGEAADWAMRLGRVDTAEAYHRAGWLMVAGRRAFGSAIADHLMYLVRANRPGRAIRLALGLVPLMEGPLDDLDTMRGSAVLARVLRAARGHRVAPSEVAGRPLDEVIRDYDATARGLARAFDQRNRTDRVSHRLIELVRIAPYPEVASEEARAADRLDVVPRRSHLLDAGTGTPAAHDLPTNVLGYSAALHDASDAFDAARVVGLVDGWVRDRERLLPVRDPVEHLSVSYLDRRALSSRRAQADEGFVEELITSASGAARMSGSAPALQRAEVEALHRQALAGDDSAWSRARTLVDELEAAGEPREAASALMSLSRNPDAAPGMRDALRAAELFARDGQPRWEVAALQAAGYAAVWADPRRSETLLERAYHGALEHDLPAVEVSILATRAKLDWQAGDLVGAEAGYRGALTRADATGATDPVALRAELCDVLLGAHRWEELIDAAAELLARVSDGDVPRLAFAHRLLGLGLLETGNAREAVEMLEPAALALGQGDPMHAVTSWTLGRALVACERPDLAGPVFAMAADGFAAGDRLPDAAAAHEAAGATLFQSGQVGAAAQHLVSAAGIGRTLGDQNRLISALRQLASVQAAQGRVNEALATIGSILPEVRALRQETGDETGPQIDEPRLRGLLQDQSARILTDGGRSDEAEEAVSDALDLLSTYGEESELAAARETYRLITGSVWTAGAQPREDHRGGKHSRTGASPIERSVMDSASTPQVAQVPMFDGLTDAELKQIVEAGTAVNVPANWSLIWEKTPADKAYIVLDGELSVRHGTEEIARLGPGDIVGETAIVRHKLRNASVVSLTRVQVLHFTREAVERLCEQIPTFNAALDAAATGRIGEATQEA